MRNNINLVSLGLTNIQLRQYQFDGVKWFIDSVKCNHGGILADEMGLGKTIQTICAVLCFKSIFDFKKFIIISPLSVINNWKNEFTKFTPNLKYFLYMGNKIERTNIRNSQEWNSEELVMITTYEYLLQDFTEINHINFDAFFMDEGHRIKNCDSILYNKVLEMPTTFKFLLTGTPIQNNFDELYNLLTIVVGNNNKILESRNHFKENLVSQLSDFTNNGNSDGILKTNSILTKLILRRTKAEQLKYLPEKTEVVIFHGLTDLQKTLYKSFLMKDVTLLQELSNEVDNESKSSNKNLLNILMQIRKCSLHPYLFNGIEKEPFELGEHLIDNSLKLQVIDKLLLYLMPLGHKILLFSQMTRMLDIVQDYCYLRGFNYERLDGSVRSEERFAAIHNFSETESTKLFLLSTRAGGQGLNLTAADTVIFIDSDFNPQVDLQAMARIHRPGQNRPCRIIRLVTRYSVEEIIVFRAQRKLSLTREILGHEENTINEKKLNLKEMVCYGVDKLFSENNENDNSLSNEFFTSILGDTDSNGCWKPVVTNNISETNYVENIKDVNHIYLFEGQNYKPKPSKSDFQALNNILKDIKDNQQFRKKTKNDLDVTKSDKKIKINKKKQQLWDENKYVSRKIEINDNDTDSDSIGRNPSDDSEFNINFIIGDVTNPIGDPDKRKIICHLVDNSGSWGSGGLFSAIDHINLNISIEYMTAGEMDDLKLGDCHVLSLKLNIELALLVAQTRDSNGRLSEVKTKYLEMCFEKIRDYAISINASIHLTRLGYKTPRFNWYSIERLINKHFTEQGIETFIYYFRRDLKRNFPGVRLPKLSEKYLKSIFSGFVICFHESVDKETKQILTRHIVAFHGQVTENPTDGNITHFLMSNEMKSIEKRIFDEKINLVKVNWIINCIYKNEIIPIAEYII